MPLRCILCQTIMATYEINFQACDSPLPRGKHEGCTDNRSDAEASMASIEIEVPSNQVNLSAPEWNDVFSIRELQRGDYRIVQLSHFAFADHLLKRCLEIFVPECVS